MAYHAKSEDRPDCLSFEYVLATCSSQSNILPCTYNRNNAKSYNESQPLFQSMFVLASLLATPSYSHQNELVATFLDEYIWDYRYSHDHERQ